MLRRRLTPTLAIKVPTADTFTSPSAWIATLTQIRDYPGDLSSSKDVGVSTWLVSGYYTDMIRMTAMRSDEKISPYEFFALNSEQIAETVNYNAQAMSSELWTHVKGAGAFPLTWANHFFSPKKAFRPRRVLDPCSGWGDRLIAAIICKVDYYCGVDPHQPLHYCYQRILQDFGLQQASVPGPKRFNLVAERFEDTKREQLDPEDLGFDMVLTSPPYSDLEIYSADDTQSSSRNSEEQWKSNFLYPMVTRSFDLLKPNGVMALFLPRPTVSYVSALLAFMKGERDVAGFEMHDLGGSHVYIWYKTWRTESFDDIPSVKVSQSGKTRGTITLNPTDEGDVPRLATQIMPAYLAAFEERHYFYVCRGRDPIALDIGLGKHPNAQLTLYLPSKAADYINQFKGVTNLNAIEYQGGYMQQLKAASAELGADGILLPEGLDVSEFEFRLTQRLKLVLYQHEDSKGRFWIKDTNLCMARCLLNVLPQAIILLAIPHRSYDVNSIPHQQRHRLQIYPYASSNDDVEHTKRSISEIRQALGYPSDYILKL